MFIYKKWFNNVETAYQSQKTTNPDEQNLIWKAETPKEARNLGQKVTMRPDWDQFKYNVMYECCMAKFLQHKDLRDQLMATGDEELVEDTKTTNDMYWGCGTNGDGQNNLGKILMEIREELKGE